MSTGDAMMTGAAIMYALAGLYILALASREGWIKRLWLAIVLFPLLWPLFLCDIQIDTRMRLKDR